MNRVSLSIGPGQHGDILSSILRKNGVLRQEFRSYPGLFSIDYSQNPPLMDCGRGFDHLQRVVWALWRRVPVWGEYNTPNGILMPVADNWMAKRIKPCDVFIGWQHLGLKTVSAAKKMGAKTVLEHPTIAATKWNDLVLEEYKLWKGITRGTNSIYSKRQIARLMTECSNADIVNVHSRFARDSMVESGLDPNRITVTELGVDETIFRPPIESKQPNSAKLKILYAGRLELAKGVQYLLEAFRSMRGKNVELHLVGSVLPEFRPLLRKFADERVKVHGPVSRNDLVKIYGKADVFVFPTIIDSFGMVVLEAMACGLPVITTTNSCAHDVVKDGYNGFVVPIRDAMALKDRIRCILDERETQFKMGLNSRRTVIDNFTLQHYEKRLGQKLIKQL